MYTQLISEVLRPIAPAINPRHVEAYIRLIYPTLNDLSSKDLEAVVSGAVLDIEIEGTETAEKLAQSFGL